MYAIRSYYVNQPDDDRSNVSVPLRLLKPVRWQRTFQPVVRHRNSSLPVRLPHRGFLPRITSYNVCYTKLLRSDVEAHERMMVRRVFHFGEKQVGDIFRPLVQVVALPEEATCRDAAVLASMSGYSRYPVYRERIDHVVGFLHVIDTVGEPPEKSIRLLMRKALYVPELMPIDELMRKFHRITSYNVCYTKLLRTSRESPPC